MVSHKNESYFVIHVNFSENYEYTNMEELNKILNGQKVKSIRFLREPKLIVKRLTKAQIEFYMKK